MRTVDLEKNPIEAQQLVQKYGVTTTGVVVASGNDKRVINSNDLAEIDFRGQEAGGPPQMTGFKGEQLFTGAILQLSEGRKPKILFTTGHGEHALDDASGHGFSGAQELLGRDNFELAEWASLGKPAVPEGTDLVVIAGPTSSFVQPELDALSGFLNNGGRMLVLLDPTLQGAGLVETHLEAWIARYGIKVGSDIVVDPSNPLPYFGPETIFIKSYGDHPVTRALAQGSVPVLVSLARSAGAGSAPGIKVSELLRTTPEGWGETDLAHLDKVRSYVDLGVKEGAKLAVDGRNFKMQGYENGFYLGGCLFDHVTEDMRIYKDFATNQLLHANTPNGLLLSNTLNWLVEREALLDIPAKKTEQVRLTLTRPEIRNIYLLAAALPLLAIALGGAVFIRRRRRA